MFTSGQIIVLYIITLFIIWCIISKGMDVIKHCSTQKTYRKMTECHRITELPPLNDVNNLNLDEEEKKDE